MFTMALGFFLAIVHLEQEGRTVAEASGCQSIIDVASKSMSGIYAYSWIFCENR